MITNMSTIMLGSSLGTNTMKNKRDINEATSTNPYSRGGLLPLHHGGDDLDLGEVEDLSGGGSGGEFPFYGGRIWLSFGVSDLRAASFTRRLGDLYIGGFYVKGTIWKL